MDNNTVNGVNLTKICLEKDKSRLSGEELLIYANKCILPTWEEQDTESYSTGSTTGYVVYFSVLVFAGIALNLLVVITIFSRNRLRTVPNAFMVSLSVADFLMAAVVIPLKISQRLQDKDNSIITILLYPCVGVASIFSLCCVTLDRYMHIKHPLNYTKYMNKVRAAGMIVGLWVFSIGQALVFLLVQHNVESEAIYNDVRLACCFGIPLIFITIVYTSLLMTARAHARVIATTSVSIQQSPLSNKKDFKMLKVIALIIGSFSVCWFPYLFALSYELHTNVDERTHTLYWFKDIAECFLCLTCVLNPLIYGLLRRDLRISMRYVAACKKESIEESQSL